MHVQQPRRHADKVEIVFDGHAPRFATPARLGEQVASIQV
jgi:hypothetical protein